MICHIIRTAAIVLMPVPAINPTNEPIAAFKEAKGSCFAQRSSPRNAPRKTSSSGQKNISEITTMPSSTRDRVRTRM